MATVDVPYVVMASIAIFLVLVPLPWHITAWNSATCYMMLWTMIGCIIHLVNSVVWYHSLANPSPVYCDITTKLSVGLSIAIPLSSLCINRRLYKIAAMTSVAITKSQKRRDVLIDTLIAVLGPMIFMAVHYTMQGHRYDIVENYGCWPSTYATAPAYAIIIAPPIIVCGISMTYALMSLRAFIRRRTEFNQVLKSSSTGLNSGRYFRLMALASSEVAIGLPTSLFFFITDLRTIGVAKWVSWDDTHYNFSMINYIPTYYFKLNRATQIEFELNRWTFPFIAFLFFGFFGLGEEARKNYRNAYYALLKPFGVKPPPSASTIGSSKREKLASSASKSLPDTTNTFDHDLTLSLPPLYTSPTKSAYDRWSHSTFDLSPTLESGTFSGGPGDFDTRQLAAADAPTPDLDAHHTLHPPSEPPFPPRTVTSPINVHVSTTTLTTTDPSV